jgi:nucleotide-binding universal stress UspA family protein
MFEKILAGYAGDRAGRDAVALAVRLAALQDGSLTIAFPYHPLLASVTADGAQERVRDELTAMLGEDEPRLQGATYRWSPSSWPIRALQELADYEGSSVIVVGAAPERVERRHVGLMERLVHGCPCAVAVAPEGLADGEIRPFQRIGVGFADSREGRAAIRTGLDLARATEGRLQVIAGAGLGAAIAGYGFSSSALPEIEQELYEQTERTLAGVLDSFDGGLEAEREVRRGDPAEVLVEASAGLDLMILGSRAYGPARRALLGSVSAEVMRRSHCPVLVLPRCSCACTPPDASTAGAGA